MTEEKKAERLNLQLMQAMYTSLSINWKKVPYDVKVVIFGKLMAISKRIGGEE